MFDWPDFAHIHIYSCPSQPENHLQDALQERANIAEKQLHQARDEQTRAVDGLQAMLLAAEAAMLKSTVCHLSFTISNLPFATMTLQFPPEHIPIFIWGMLCNPIMSSWNIHSWALAGRSCSRPESQSTISNGSRERIGDQETHLQRAAGDKGEQYFATKMISFCYGNVWLMFCPMHRKAIKEWKLLCNLSKQN